MSIKRMSDVWDKSTHTSSDLLLLLALADAANDDGHCWPGIGKLCTKTRLSESTVIRRTRAIEKSGELVVKRNRRHGNKYLVVTGFTPEQIEALIKQYFGEKFLTVKLQDKSNLQNDSSELASCDSSELAPVTDDPSLTVIDPSKTSPAQEAAPDAPRYAVGMRVVFAVDNAVGTVRERVNQDGAWDYLVMWDDGVHPEWHPESALTPAPDPTPPVPPADPPTPPTPKRGRAPDLLFEAVAAAFKYERMNDSERGQVNKACKLLRQSQVTPEEVPSLYAWCVAQGWPGAFTPLAMAKHVNDWRNSQKPGGATNTNGISIGARLPVVRAPAEVCA